MAAAQELRTQRYRTEDVQSDAGSFSDLLLPQPLVTALAAAGFQRPSPVQKAAIPIGRVGTDLIVQAKSGTGKTAVFAAILLERMDLQVSTPQALVLAPTRELAVQSFQVIQRVSEGLPQPGPSAAVFVGGLPTADDEKRLRRVCHIAVGSPGRLCGLITSGALLVGTVKSVVLDEADQLLSEGFYADTAWLLQQLPKRKQVLALSATYTPELLADLEPLMRRPQKVLLCEETVSLLGIRQFYKLVGDTAIDSSSSGASNGASSSTADAAAAAAAATGVPSAPAAQQPQLHQNGVKAGPAGEEQEPQLSIAEQQQLLVLKVEALLQLLSSVSFHQAVVFCNRKPAAEWLARRLTAAGCPSAHLSSDLPQTERMAAMEAVRGFKVRLIVSTDVMARGVDFDRVNLVVNVDLPPDPATYVHRVGRTGRFGSRGIAVALLTPRELAKLQQYLVDVKGGDLSPLPEVIPSDLYSFELSSDWEKDAYQQLLAAPTSTPPDSPPPLRKKKPTAQEQEQQEDGLAVLHNHTTAAAAAAAAELSAFGYDESALSCFDWEEDADTSADQQQQQQQQQEGTAAAAAAQDSSVQQGGEAAGQDAAYDPAAAWEVWAAYYRSLGYEYPHSNPYTQQAAAAVAPPAAAAAAATAAVGDQGAAAEQLPQLHGVVLAEGEEEECEDEEEEGWELPDDDDIDYSARRLLSRLHVTQEAAALAAPVPAAAASQAAAQPVQEQQHSVAAVAAPAVSATSGQQHPAGAGHQQAVCGDSWAASYTAWQQQYAAWQQQFSTWCQQYQQQQHRQWQQYSSWCEAYQQQQLSQQHSNT